MRVSASLLALALALSAARADTPAAKPAPTKPAPVKPAAPPPSGRPVKQESRAELEAEVEQLRAENVKLRADLDRLVKREKDRAKRLEDSTGAPATTLK